MCVSLLVADTVTSSSRVSAYTLDHHVTMGSHLYSHLNISLQHLSRTRNNRLKVIFNKYIYLFIILHNFHYFV